MRKLVIAATAAALGTTGLGAVQAPADAGIGWQVTVKASSTQVKVGHRLVFTGKVGPRRAAAGHQVTLQEKFKPGRPWKTQHVATTDAKGHYRLVDRPTVNTDHKYRVLMPATPHHARGVSSVIDVKVYGWSKLVAHPYVNARSMLPTSSVNLNGTSYPKSVVATWTGAASVEFNLNHKCTALRGTFGVSDNSQTGAQSTVTAQSDGTQIYTKTLSVGQTDVARILLDSPLKLKLTSQSVVAGAYGFGALGTPEILCVR
jgi:hypothetical protein